MKVKVYFKTWKVVRIKSVYQLRNHKPTRKVKELDYRKTKLTQTKFKNN